MMIVVNQWPAGGWPVVDGFNSPFSWCPLFHVLAPCKCKKITRQNHVSYFVHGMSLHRANCLNQDDQLRHFMHIFEEKGYQKEHEVRLCASVQILPILHDLSIARTIYVPHRHCKTLRTGFKTIIFARSTPM